MPHKYSGPTLQLDFWAITRRDLERIASFIARNFDPPTLNIALETSSRRNRVCTNFADFFRELEIILSLAEEIWKIDISSRKATAAFRKHFWIEIDFRFNLAEFHLYGEDQEGVLKSWMQSAHNDMQKLIDFFQASPEFAAVLKRDFRRYPERRRNQEQGVIILDFDGRITQRITQELAAGAQDGQPKSSLSRRWPWERISVFMIILLVLLLLLNILLFLRSS